MQFPELKVTSSNYLFCLTNTQKSEDFHVTVLQNRKGRWVCGWSLQQIFKCLEKEK